jgi:hypothetical protein
VIESESIMEGVREDVVGARKYIDERSGSIFFGRAEEKDMKSAPGQVRKGIRPPIEVLFAPLNAIES